MLATLVMVDVLPEFADAFAAASAVNHENSRKEPGNVRFDVLRDNRNPNHFVLYEVYEDEAAAITGELSQEFRHVGLTVVVCAFGIAGRVHARRTAECLHLQSRVVGEAVEMIVVKDILCLLMGIFLKRVACLGDVLVAADVTERDNLEVRTEDFTYLAQLMLVVGSKNYFHALLFCS